MAQNTGAIPKGSHKEGGLFQRIAHIFDKAGDDYFWMVLRPFTQGGRGVATGDNDLQTRRQRF